MPNHFSPTFVSVTTDIPLPTQCIHAEHTTPHGITVKVDGLCIGQTFQLCSDLITALEYGATPEAHLVMIDRINRAEAQGFPLSCSLEFCA